MASGHAGVGSGVPSSWSTARMPGSSHAPCFLTHRKAVGDIDSLQLQIGLCSTSSFQTVSEFPATTLPMRALPLAGWLHGLSELHSPSVPQFPRL